MGFTDEFAELYDSTITAYLVVTDGWGTFVPSGAGIAIPCRVEGRQRLIRAPDGSDVYSSYAVYTQGFNNLSVYSHRFALESEYLPYGVYPSGLLTALAIEKVNDEDGPCFEVISF